MKENKKIKAHRILKLLTVVGVMGILTILSTTKPQAQRMEKAGTSSYGTTGNYQSFANGYIYQSKHGTYSVWGEIKEIHNKNGGTWGLYGFPTSDRYMEGPTGRECQNFENNQKICIGGVEPEPKCKANEVEINEKCYSKVDNDGDGIPTELENELVQKYAPIIYVSAGDNLKPANVDWYLDRSDLYYFKNINNNLDKHKKINSGLINDNDLIVTVDKNSGEQLIFGSGGDTIHSTSNRTPENHFYLKHKNFLTTFGSTSTNDWTLYANTYYKDDRIKIEYWYFLPHNNPPDILEVGVHEGDWEHIEVSVDKSTLEPEYAKYAMHEISMRYSWCASTHGELNRPRVYIAEGTHASFPTIDTLRNSQYPQPTNENDFGQIAINCANGSEIIKYPGDGASWRFSEKFADTITWHSERNIYVIGENVRIGDSTAYTPNLSRTTNLRWGKTGDHNLSSDNDGYYGEIDKVVQAILGSGPWTPKF